MAKKAEAKFTYQGQSAAPIDAIPFDKLNRHEQAIVLTLAAPTLAAREAWTIAEIMYENNWHVLGKAKGNSRVRNSLRRLVRSNWVEHGENIGDGTYLISRNGYFRLRRFEGKNKPAKKASAKQVEVEQAETETAAPAAATA